MAKPIAYIQNLDDESMWLLCGSMWFGEAHWRFQIEMLDVTLDALNEIWQEHLKTEHGGE